MWCTPNILIGDILIAREVHLLNSGIKTESVNHGSSSAVKSGKAEVVY
jgi:hypothetical protein